MNNPERLSMSDLLNDSLPLLTETVSEPDLPVLEEMLQQQAHEQAEQQIDDLYHALPPEQAEAIAHLLPGNIETQLHQAARLIMHEVIDDYMLQIENELHRRLEEHLQQLLRGGH